jgi:hypothetical protein
LYFSCYSYRPFSSPLLIHPSICYPSLILSDGAQRYLPPLSRSDDLSLSLNSLPTKSHDFRRQTNCRATRTGSRISLRKIREVVIESRNKRSHRRALVPAENKAISNSDCELKPRCMIEDDTSFQYVKRTDVGLFRARKKTCFSCWWQCTRHEVHQSV